MKKEAEEVEKAWEREGGDDVRCIVGGEGGRGRQPDREVVSVYQEHTALAGSSLSVVVPSSSLLQHLPARHQAEQDPVPSTAHLKTGAPSIAFSSRPSCLLLLIPAHNSLSSHQTVWVTLNQDPRALIYSFHTHSAPSSLVHSYSSAAQPTLASSRPPCHAALLLSAAMVRNHKWIGKGRTISDLRALNQGAFSLVSTLISESFEQKKKCKSGIPWKGFKLCWFCRYGRN